MLSGLCTRERGIFLGRMLWFNQALAVPIALILVSSHQWIPSIVIATVYSQVIGALCFVTGAAMKVRARNLPPARFRLAALATNFVAGAVGAEIARRIVVQGFGYNVGLKSGVLSIAIGVSVALFVGALMTNQELLRFALEASQQALQERELAEAKLLRAKTEAELAALQARINPHFLFNTLNSISALITEDPARADQMIGRLSALLRYALQPSRRGAVPIQEELTIVRGYLDIEQVRLGARLCFAIDVQPELLDREIPVLLLQPIVENAIKHGIAPLVQGGRVDVRGWREGDDAVFTVSDDGDGASSVSGTGVGLENVRQRLEAMYGPAATVELQRREGRTETRLVLPLWRPLRVVQDS